MLTVEGNAKVSVGLIHYRSTVYTGRCNFPVVEQLLAWLFNLNAQFCRPTLFKLDFPPPRPAILSDHDYQKLN